MRRNYTESNADALSDAVYVHFNYRRPPPTFYTQGTWDKKSNERLSRDTLIRNTVYEVLPGVFIISVFTREKIVK